MSRHDERRFATSLLDQLLGGGASSRLFQEIRERRGMAYAVYTFGSHYRETGHVGVYVGTRGENVEECLSVIGREIGVVAAGDFDPDELERAKDAMKGRLALSMESTSARMGRLGRAILHDQPLLDEDEIAARIDAVTVDDIATLAGELFAPARLSAAVHRHRRGGVRHRGSTRCSRRPCDPRRRRRRDRPAGRADLRRHRGRRRT